MLLAHALVLANNQHKQLLLLRVPTKKAELHWDTSLINFAPLAVQVLPLPCGTAIILLCKDSV